MRFRRELLLCFRGDFRRGTDCNSRVRPPCRTIAEGWPLEMGWEWWVRRQGKREAGQERLPFEWSPIPTYTYAATAPLRLVSSVYHPFPPRAFILCYPPTSFLVYFPNVRIASCPSRRLTSLSTTLSLDAQGNAVTFSISSWRATRVVNIVVQLEIWLNRFYVLCTFAHLFLWRDCFAVPLCSL